MPVRTARTTIALRSVRSRMERAMSFLNSALGICTRMLQTEDAMRH
jgi:hypothetical protein